MPSKAQLEASLARHRAGLESSKGTEISINGDPFTVALVKGSHEIEPQESGPSRNVRVLTFLLSKEEHPAKPGHGGEVEITDDADEAGKYTLNMVRNQGEHWLCKAARL